MLAVASRPIQLCMSSLRMSLRVRPKSPPLQPASASVTSNARNGKSDLIGETVSGMSNVQSSLAAATPAARCSALLRPAAPARFIVLTLDANDGKDQDGPDGLERGELHR